MLLQQSNGEEENEINQRENDGSVGIDRLEYPRSKELLGKSSHGYSARKSFDVEGRRLLHCVPGGLCSQRHKHYLYINTHRKKNEVGQKGGREGCLAGLPRLRTTVDLKLYVHYLRAKSKYSTTVRIWKHKHRPLR